MKVFFLNYTKTKISKPHVMKVIKILHRYFAKNRVLSSKLSKIKGIEDISIVFVKPAQSKMLNKKFRRKNYATDVLSFAPREDGAGLGELVLCVDVLKRQAKDQGHSFQNEVDIMMIHGFLHLLGFDHEKSLKEEQRMMKIQNILINKMF